MKNNFAVFLFLFFTICFSYSVAEAQQKARIISDAVDVYAEQNFDSEILDTVHFNETYWISNKTYGPFYRIKLKSGKIGYIPDHELDIEGKGRFKPKKFGESETESNSSKEEKSKTTVKNKSKSQLDQEMDENDQMQEDYENSEGFNFHSFSVNLINYHEDTMGSQQVSDLWAIGYRRLTQDYAWGGMLSLKTPEYYIEKTGGKGTGFSLWGDIAANYFLPMNSRFMARVTPGIMMRYSLFKIETSTRNYDLQDLVVGVFIEAGMMVRIQKVYTEVSLRFNHEKNDYGGIGLALLF